MPKKSQRIPKVPNRPRRKDSLRPEGFKNLELRALSERPGPVCGYNRNGQPIRGHIVTCTHDSTNRYSPKKLKQLARERGVGRPV